MSSQASLVCSLWCWDWQTCPAHAFSSFLKSLKPQSWPPSPAALAEMCVVRKPVFSMKEFCRACLILVAIVASACVLTRQQVVAQETQQAVGEPVESFVKQLKAAGYFDTAVAYLERLDEWPGVSPDVKSRAKLELANVYIDGAVVSRSVDQRDQNFALAEQALKDFLKQSSHPQFAEARTMLAKLQLLRASQLISGKPNADQRTQACASFLAAAESFDQIVAELKEKLTGMQGQKINATDEPEKVALREQYYSQYLDSKINGAEANKLAGMTFEKPSEGGKQYLEEAIKRFAEIFDKYSNYPSGAMSLMHLGQLNLELGNNNEALDAFLRMLEQPEINELREGKLAAASGLAEIWLAKSPANYASAIERGQGMLDTLLPNEVRMPIVQSLRLNVAKAYLMKSKDKENNRAVAVKQAKTAARELLRDASKVSGTHLAEVQKLLAGMGIDSEEKPVPIAEDPATFGEAFDSMQILVRAVSMLESSRDLLAQQKDNEQIAAQVESLDQEISDKRSAAINLISRGLRLVSSETDADSLNQSRQVLAYLLWQEKRYREAAVVGGYLAYKTPGNRIGLDGGLLALSALQSLAGSASEEQVAALSGQISELGSYLAEVWPNDPRAAGAKGVVISLALKMGRWDEAESMIAKMPDGEKKASFQRSFGMNVWNRSIRAKAAGQIEESQEFVKTAETWLVRGLSEVKTSEFDKRAAEAALVLSRVHLKLDQPGKAVADLDNPQSGPLKLLEKLDAPTAKFVSDVYSAELQAVVGMMTAGDDSDGKLLKRAERAMENLVGSVTGDDAQKRLVLIFIGMSKSIRERIEGATPDEKKKLLGAFQIFLDKIGQSSNDPATLQWVGQQLLQLGEESIGVAQTKATGQAASLIQSSITTFERLIEVSAEPPLSVKFQLARANRLAGKYQQAINLLAEILKQKPTMLDAQIEAATAYEQWAPSVGRNTPKAYDWAMMGARPGADKKNVIWGWGKISLLTQRDAKRQAEFYDARYHIAVCRFRRGEALKSKKLIEQAIKDITSISDRYPELGSRAQRRKFDLLLREIQKAAGKPVTGLPPLPVAKPS